MGKPMENPWKTTGKPQKTMGKMEVYPLVMTNSLLWKMAESVNFPMKNGGSFYSYGKLPEGI